MEVTELNKILADFGEEQSKHSDEVRTLVYHPPNNSPLPRLARRILPLRRELLERQRLFVLVATVPNVREYERRFGFSATVFIVGFFLAERPRAGAPRPRSVVRIVEALVAVRSVVVQRQPYLPRHRYSLLA